MQAFSKYWICLFFLFNNLESVDSSMMFLYSCQLSARDGTENFVYFFAKTNEYTLPT